MTLRAAGGEGSDTCEWTQDEDGVWWACGDNAWIFNDEPSPADHGAIFCMFCGKRIAQCSYQPPKDEDDQ